MRAPIRCVLWLVCIAAGFSAEAQTPPPNTPVRISQQTTLTTLRALPPTAPVEIASGRKIPAQRFVAVADAIRRAQSQPRRASPSGFSKTAAPANVVLRPGSHLPSVMARPDSDVVQLPNGVKLTVGDMKKLAEVSPALKGRALLTSTRADLQGPATKVATGQDLRNLRNAPDSTIVENPNGVRVTLGELRAHARTQRR
jgi:hypothetical protein